MSTETDTVELAVPDAAVAALHEAGDEPLMEYVRAIAAPVVAAELRRIAADDIHRDDKGWAVAGWLRARAAELDPS